MPAADLLTSLAIVFVAAAVWDDLRRNDRVTPARKTYLLVGCLFALISAVVNLVR